MKKILCILLCAVMLLSLLAGCGGGDKTDPTESTKHSHTYAKEWSYDETNHWYQATCEHSTLQANLGEHLDEDLDAVCDVCGYESADCQHTYSQDWSSDEQFHWHAATCNHIGSIAEKGEHADEDNDGACDVCQYMGDHTHSFQEEWAADETQHWHMASCGHDVETQREDHVDLNNDGACDTCAWEDPNHTHTFGEDWATDATFHWHPATCEHTGAYGDQEQHFDADDSGYCDVCDYLICVHEDYDLDGVCDKCGFEDPEHTHEFGEEIGSSVNGHWFIAVCHPGATTELEAHIDENNDGVCDVCQFQTCGHSYAATWTFNETHHWHAILCTCSIERKDYAEHVDADGDGGCDVCMYGVPVEAVFEVVLKDEPFTLVETGMITYAAVTINFPQAGRYVITPSNEEMRVWMTDGSDSGTDNAYYNPQSALTLDVTSAGEMTLYFRYFDFDYEANKQVPFTYSVIRMDDLMIDTMQGKVELPTNTLYTVKFVAKEIGVYKLITGVDGLVIGLSEDTMEYYKGHVELNVTYVGQEFTFYIRYDDAAAYSFIFDWRLETSFCLRVGEGNYAVNVAPNQIDYKIEFTAPADGYYLLEVHNQWLTFAQMGEVYNEPVRLETMEVLTHKMAAGEVYTIWLQTVYNYPEATNVYDTLTITNVGQCLTLGTNTVTPGDQGSRYCVQADRNAYFRVEVTGGELGILAPNGDISWTDKAYEAELKTGNTFSFLVRGSGSVTVKITPVVYTTDLYNGTNTVTMEPNRYYTVRFLYGYMDESGQYAVVDMSSNSTISLNWEGSLTVLVNGEEYEKGTALILLNTEVKILVKSNGPTDVKITVSILDDANSREEVQGSSNAELVLHQITLLAVNRDGDGAYAYYTAEFGGSFTLTSNDAKAVVYVEAADGSRTQVLVGASSYTFNLNVGETIRFYVNTSDESEASISVTLTPGN